MRVGILTFHKVANPGAYLQAYSTQQILRRMGHDAIIIDYVSPGHRYSPWRFVLRHPWFTLTHPSDLTAVHRLESTYATCQQYLAKTRPFRTRCDVASERFDAIVVGADIVWNYGPKAMGRDPIYFGSHLNSTRLVAFAPSCGNLALDAAIPNYVQSGLSRFGAMAVRDDNTADLVQQAIGKRPRLIADPTFALQLESLPEVHNFDPDYLLVYGIRSTIDPETQRAISDFARSRRLRTVAACYYHDWVDENDIANPFRWIGRIRCARYVFTTAFHGTVFALKLGKAFAVKYTPPMVSKIRPTVEALGCSGRVCDSLSQLSEILETPWDVQAVQQRMSSMANDAREYLGRALEQGT